MDRAAGCWCPAKISRVQPGDATLKVLVSDFQGKKIATGEMPLAHASGATRPFSTNLQVPPGTYIVRLGVMDSAGRVGSVDHRAEVRDMPLGTLTATGPVLVRVPAAHQGAPRLALDAVRQDERLALEVDLEGDKSRLENTVVEFEVAASGDGPALLRAPAALSPGSRQGSMIAQGVADMRLLPPGDYLIRAKVATGAEPLGDVRRGFTVTAAPRLVAADAPSNVGAAAGTTVRAAGRLPVAAPAPFAVEQVLGPPILGAFLERVASRPDTSSPVLRELLERARTQGVSGLAVSDAQAAAGPAGRFPQGPDAARRQQARTGRRSVPRCDACVRRTSIRRWCTWVHATRRGARTRKLPRRGARRSSGKGTLPPST